MISPLLSRFPYAIILPKEVICVIAAISVLAALWLVYLCWEAVTLSRARGKLLHVIHVNGTRGKSTVSRLIDAGLRAGGVKVYCKTTGTDPMTIDVVGEEKPLLRRGKANIKEQIRILKAAADQGAQVLVIECMAVLPEYQWASQHRILRADLGVITNVRRDHTDVMGTTLEEVCASLCNTVPVNGTLFTADSRSRDRLQRAAEKAGSRFVYAEAGANLPELDFPENVALALAVCRACGVSEETALEGMRSYRADPYRLSLHRLGDAVFVGGLSINDMESILLVWQKLSRREELVRTQAGKRRFIVIVNNRPDRGSRTEDMLLTVQKLAPDEVWLLGAGRGYFRRKLGAQIPVVSADSVEALPFGKEPEAVYYAIGNLAGQGRNLMQKIREEGTDLV